MYIITELLVGGDLLEALLSGGAFNEDQARAVMRQMLLGLQYMHDRLVSWGGGGRTFKTGVCV